MKPIDSIFNQFIQNSGKLLALPDIYNRLDELLKSKQASIADIGFLISTDAALTTQVLKLANSPAFSFKAEITNIDRAISLIGSQELKTLVLMEIIIKNFNTRNCAVIAQEDFWRRSVYQAIISKKLALRLFHPDPERLFVCGILSRIGLLICCQVNPELTEQATHIQSTSLEKNAELLQEKEVLDFTFNQLSALFLEHWKIPVSIWNPIYTLSFPIVSETKIQQDFQLDSSILYVSNIFSFLLEQMDNQPVESADLIEQLPQTIIQQLALDQEFINEMLLDIEMDAMEILAAVFPDSSNIY